MPQGKKSSAPLTPAQAERTPTVADVRAGTYVGLSGLKERGRAIREAQEREDRDRQTIHRERSHKDINLPWPDTRAHAKALMNSLIKALQ
jgi:predicted ATPase